MAITKQSAVERDIKLGRKTRSKWRKILRLGKEYGIDESQIRGYVAGGGLHITDAARKKLAKSLGFDWEGAAEFFATIAPIIIEMMAACA